MLLIHFRISLLCCKDRAIVCGYVEYVQSYCASVHRAYVYVACRIASIIFRHKCASCACNRKEYEI